MKKQWLLLPLILLGACRTPADAKENKKMERSLAAQSVKLLQKVVGKLDGKTAQVFDCSVYENQVPDVEAVKKMIVASEAASLNKAVHIVATTPSLEIYAFNAQGKPVTLVIDYSDYQYRDDEASKSLIKLAHEKCPTPAKS